MAQVSNETNENVLQLPLSQIQDSNNVCYQNAVENQTTAKTTSETLIDLSSCNSNLTEQDKSDLGNVISSNLEKFFLKHDIETPDGVLSVVHSLSYGDMLISFLLLAILVVFVIKWFWEVLRY